MLEYPRAWSCNYLSLSGCALSIWFCSFKNELHAADPQSRTCSLASEPQDHTTSLHLTRTPASPACPTLGCSYTSSSTCLYTFLYFHKWQLHSCSCSGQKLGCSFWFFSCLFYSVWPVIRPRHSNFKIHPEFSPFSALSLPPSWPKAPPPLARVTATDSYTDCLLLPGQLCTNRVVLFKPKSDQSCHFYSKNPQMVLPQPPTSSKSQGPHKDQWGPIWKCSR